MPFFEKFEKTKSLNNLTDTNDRLNIEDINMITPYGLNHLQGNIEIGKKLTNCNGESQTQVPLAQQTTRNGRKISANIAFLNPLKKRNNVKIMTKSLVLKLLFKNNVTVGVRYLQNSDVYCAYANKEVILSAGAINSPQLLMLSGIGPKKHLEDLNITLVQDLPVGQNMWDHYIVPGPFISAEVPLKIYSQQELAAQFLQGKGSYTSAGYQNLDCSSVYWSNLERADVEHLFNINPASTKEYYPYQKIYNIKQSAHENVYLPQDGKVIWYSHSILLHPKSRGTITLKSKSPLDFPLIDLNSFSDPEDSDVNTLVAGMKDTLKLVQTKAMQSIGSEVLNTELTACQGANLETDDGLQCYVRHLAMATSHTAGTCKMGPASQSSSVVGSDLKVHGIKGLRVVDCSVIPVTISGHTMAVAYMIGEKAADMIKKEFRINVK